MQVWLAYRRCLRVRSAADGEVLEKEEGEVVENES